jgi:YD repeat-containing protein
MNVYGHKNLVKKAFLSGPGGPLPTLVVCGDPHFRFYHPVVFELMKAVLMRTLLFLFAARSVTEKVSAETFAFSNDPLARLTNATFSDGSRESYSYDAAGNRLSRVTLAATNPSDVTAPSIPTNLVSSISTPSLLSIAWNRAFDSGGSGLAGYQVYVNGSLSTTTSGTNFSLSGLMPNVEYCLTVAAYDHSGNVSAQSSSLCLTTPVFQPPFLSPLGFVGGHFHIGIASGTPGPYNVLVSSNLLDWQLGTNLILPASNNLFIDPSATNFKQRFYQLLWSTNTP